MMKKTRKALVFERILTGMLVLVISICSALFVAFDFTKEKIDASASTTVDATEQLVLGDWGAPESESDLRYLWFMDYGVLSTSGYAEWWNDNGATNAALNNGVDIMEYIYIDGVSTRTIVTKNQQGETSYVGTNTWPHTIGGIYAPVGVFSTASGVGMKVLLSYKTSFVLTVKAGFQITTTDGTIYTISKDVNFQINEPGQGYSKIEKYTLSFGEVETREIVAGAAIGELPAVPEKDGYIGAWAIDGVLIETDAIYNYGADKTATAVYFKDIKDVLGVDNWGTAVGADCTYLRVGSERDASGNLEMSTAFTNRHWQDIGDKISENYNCDIMEYIYINGKSAREISTENGISKEYGGEDSNAVTFPFTVGSIYAPIDVYTDGTTFYVLIMTEYIANEDIVIVFKAGFKMAASDGSVLYLSEDVAFPYYNVTIDGVTQTVLNGEKIEKPATEPTKESTAEYDYTFDGWYNGDVKWDFENDTVNGNLELVARFTETKRNYTISFNVTGIDGIVIDSMTLPYGTVCMSDDLSALVSDKNVSGYNYTITVNGELITSLTIVSDVTVDVEFVEKVYYTVTIDGVAQTVEQGQKVERPATEPTEESTAEYDYTFDGWYNGDVKWDFENDTVNGNLELVARFTEAKRNYTISFNITGNDAITLEPMTVKYGTTCTLSDLVELLRREDVENYTYTVTVDNVAVTSITVIADVRVDIQFVEKVYYTVTIDGVAQMVEQGQKVKKPATEPTKESTAEYDYTFDGWYNGDVKWDFENDTVNGNLELVAKFTETRKTSNGNDDYSAVPFGCAGIVENMAAIALLGVASFGILWKKKEN